jgi:hypothetical protein
MNLGRAIDLMIKRFLLTHTHDPCTFPGISAAKSRDFQEAMPEGHHWV